jgi:hypothetical protein
MGFDSWGVATQLANTRRDARFGGGPFLPAPVRQRFVNDSMRLLAEPCQGQALTHHGLE